MPLDIRVKELADRVEVTAHRSRHQTSLDELRSQVLAALVSGARLRLATLDETGGVSDTVDRRNCPYGNPPAAAAEAPAACDAGGPGARH
jgi:hypothetical protein